jgi:GNAT superfamily N-acetyltransferase
MVNIRRFLPMDAERCFKIRSEAFIRKFYDEIGPEAVSAGVNAYLPDDFVQMAKNGEFFVVEENDIIIGFFAIRRNDVTTAEIPFIYVALNHVGEGFGRASVRFIEEWISFNWPEVERLVVESIIPTYNSGFYKTVGFAPREETICEFPGLRIKALRLSKELNC